MTGINAFLDILAAAGVRYVFGNPGTTELPLNDALVTDPRFQYIFGLQEIPLAAAADGYAMASGQVGVVCVHVGCGLGNAMGMLYNAWVEGTPLLVVAGHQDRRLRVGEPVLDGDTLGVARPWTKWVCEVQRVEDIPTLTRRAIQTALAPPSGPVFLSLPVDIQMESVSGLDLRPPSVIDRRVRPPREALERAAQVLCEARSPLILAGSRVTESGGVNELIAVAERLGAPVFSECHTSHGRLPMPPRHPLYAGVLRLWSPDVLAQLSGHDVIFAVGLNVLRLYIWREPECPLPHDARLIHMDSTPWEIGKNYPVEIGLLGDPRTGLGELAEILAATQTAEQTAAANARRKAAEVRRTAERSELRARIESERDRRPLTPHVFMDAIARVLPPGAAVIEEAITTHNNLLEKLEALTDPSGHFAHRGWALGWGLGCALGVKLAWPERPVLGLLGDGAALYGIQGLWTAAHHQIPVTFVIANNAQYKILKVCGDQMPLLTQMARHNYLGIDLVAPEVDFVGLAAAFGVESRRVTGPDELSDCLRDAFARPRPLLLDVPIER